MVVLTGDPQPSGRMRRWALVAAVLVMATSGLVAAFGFAPHRASGSTALGDADAGAEVYRQHCAMCHGADGSGMMGMHPAVRGAVERLSLAGVEVTVRNGRSTTPPMPAFGDRLSDAEIDDVIAYIDALPDGPRNFGPGDDGGMGGMGDMGGGMMMDDGAPMWMWALIVVLVAGVAGLAGYIIGRDRQP